MDIIGKIKRKKHSKSVPTQPNQEDALYHALTPTSNIQNGQEYMAALDWALKQDDIRNIAVSGPYGSGKSSVINTYIKTRELHNVLPISLAAFNLENTQVSKGVSVDDELETGILKQLLYHVRTDQIPESRYRKIQSENKIENAFHGIVLELLFLILLQFAFPIQVQTFIASISRLPSVLSGITFIVIILIIWFACIYIVRWFRKSGSVQEIKILDKATLRSGDKNDSESVFNKNMDEIIYFFEETDYRIVVIEDLDRFKSTSIFVALRELNNLLNHYEGIKEKITFIYAIKDDMFQKEGERTKFFDFIIPVVPYISSTNSGEVLRTRLQFDDETDASNIYEISGRYISLISPYISDMRDLECICNEFIVFKNTLKGNQHLDLNDQQMFSLIIFKNLFPKDFAQLEDETDDSIVRCAFNDKKLFIEAEEKQLRERQEEQEEIIRKVKQEVFSNTRDIKIALLSCLTNYSGWIRSISYGNNHYSYKDLLEEDFDFDVLKKRRLTLSIARVNSSYENLAIDDIEDSVIKNGGDYFERIDRARKGFEASKEDAKRKIEGYERSMKGLRSYPIKKIITEFGTDFLSEAVRSNNLLVFLLRNGFIDENYTNYINYFHPNSISKDEMNFILAVRDHKSDEDYTYPLRNVAQIFERLQDYEFAQREVLNFDLIDYVLEKKTESSAESYLINQLSDHSESSMAFIKSYVERGHNVERLVQLLCHENNQFWIDICNDSGIPLETRFIYLKLIISNASIDDIEIQNKNGSSNNALSDFFLSNSDVLERLKGVPIEKQTQVIDALDLMFTDLEIDNLDEAIKQYIFDHSCYEINEIMLHRLVDWKAPELAEKLRTKNYTTIRMIAYQPLIDNIHRHFDDYISNIVLGIDSNTEEDIDAVEDIIERLSPGKIEQAISVLKKENVVWKTITDCCKSIAENDDGYRQRIWAYLLANNRITCSWSNVEAYFKEYGDDDTWTEYIARNIDALVFDASETVILDDIKEKLLFDDFSEKVFRKIVTGIYKEPYTNALNKLDPMKIQVLIEEHAVPFRKEQWVELSTVAPGLRMLYAENNSRDFIQSLDGIELTLDEVNHMLESEVFNGDQKVLILKKLTPTRMTIETARILRLFDRSVPKEYVNKAWQLLTDSEKYQLLLNQMDVYSNDELAPLFGQLSSEYEQLAKRTKHKYTLGYSDYNKALLEKLKAREYITRIDDVYIEKPGKALSSIEREHVLMGYVKQPK